MKQDVNVETNINDNLNVYGDININSGKLIMPDRYIGKILVADMEQVIRKTSWW